jgi:hypothetical protein
MCIVAELKDPLSIELEVFGLDEGADTGVSNANEEPSAKTAAFDKHAGEGSTRNVNTCKIMRHKGKTVTRRAKGTHKSTTGVDEKRVAQVGQAT